MRPDLMEPAVMNAGVLVDALGVAGEVVPVERAAVWSALEQILAYDWAKREYLHASDAPVRRRERPMFIGLETPGELDGIAGKLRDLHAPHRIYETCTHAERDDDDHLDVELDDGEWTCNGSYAYSVCVNCCLDQWDGRSEVCLDNHDHEPGKPICPTIAILNGDTNG